MELTLQEAESRLCELVTAAENGERVVIVKDGEPSVQLVRCKRKEGGGLDWDRLNDIRRERIKDPPGRSRGDDSRLSRPRPEPSRAGT